MQAGTKDAADQNFDYMFKLLIIGNSSVGKTSFLFRYSDDSFSSSFVSTVGIDFKVKTVFQQDKRIKLQIWVCTLQPSTRKHHYRDTLSKSRRNFSHKFTIVYLLRLEGFFQLFLTLKVLHVKCVDYERNFFYLPFKKRSKKHPNYSGIAESETANRIQSKYLLKKFVSNVQNDHDQPKPIAFISKVYTACHPISAAVHFLALEYSAVFHQTQNS